MKSCREWDELISAYSDSELGPEQRQLVEEHLAGCAECRQKLESCRQVNLILSSKPQLAGYQSIKEDVLTRIRKLQTQHHPQARWGRKMLIAAPLAIILAALLIIRPWGTAPDSQSLLARIYAANESIQTYKASLAVNSVGSDGLNVLYGFEGEFVLPNRYHMKFDDQGEQTEVIIIGGSQYVKNGNMTRPAINSAMSYYLSYLTRETTLNYLNMLSDVHELEGANLDGAACLHYRGKYDYRKQMEQQLASTKEQLSKTVKDEEQLNKIMAEMEKETESNIQAFEASQSFTEIELWIGRDDFLIRQMQIKRRMPDSSDGSKYVDSSFTMRFFDLNQPIAIKAPLDASGQLLSGWKIAGSLTPDSTQPVFIWNYSSSIGSQPGYDDWDHQQINYQVTLTNQSAETVRDVHLYLTVPAESEGQKARTIEGQPEKPGSRDMGPDESAKYQITWNFDAGGQTKAQILDILDNAALNVEFMTQDGRELSEQNLSAPRTPPDSQAR